MKLTRVTTKDGEVYFINSKTGEKVPVDPMFTRKPNDPPINSGTRISCPKCNTLAYRGSYNTWQIVVSIIFFPIGLLALLAGREPSKCEKCGYTWLA